MAAPQAPQARQAPPKPSTNPNIVLAALVARYGAKKALAMAAQQAAAQGGSAAVAPVAADAGFKAASTMLPNAATGSSAPLASPLSAGPIVSPLLPIAAVALADKWMPQTVGKATNWVGKKLFGGGSKAVYDPKEFIKNNDIGGGIKTNYKISQQVKDWGSLADPAKIALLDQAEKIGALRMQGPTTESATPFVDFASVFRDPNQTQANSRGTLRDVAINNGTYMPTREELENTPRLKPGARQRYLDLWDMMQGKGAPATPTMANNKVGGSMSNVAPTNNKAIHTLEYQIPSDQKENWVNGINWGDPKRLQGANIFPSTFQITPQEAAQMASNSSGLAEALANVYSGGSNRSQTRSPGIDLQGRRINYGKR